MELPAGEGWWLPSVPGIVLDARLDRVGLRCVLTHELAHEDHQDQQVALVGRDGPRLARRQEKKADRVAAGRLVTVDELADAIAVHEWPEDVAAALDVTVHLLRVRLQALTATERDVVAARVASVERGS